MCLWRAADAGAPNSERKFGARRPHIPVAGRAGEVGHVRLCTFTPRTLCMNDAPLGKEDVLAVGGGRWRSEFGVENRSSNTPRPGSGGSGRTWSRAPVYIHTSHLCMNDAALGDEGVSAASGRRWRSEFRAKIRSSNTPHPGSGVSGKRCRKSLSCGFSLSLPLFPSSLLPFFIMFRRPQPRPSASRSTRSSRSSRSSRRRPPPRPATRRLQRARPRRPPTCA